MISIANVSQTDKMIRLVAGLVVGAVAFLMYNSIGSTAGIVMWIVSTVLIATGALNFCPVYTLLGISTRKNVENQQ